MVFNPQPKDQQEPRLAVVQIAAGNRPVMVDDLEKGMRGITQHAMLEFLHRGLL